MLEKRMRQQMRQRMKTSESRLPGWKNASLNVDAKIDAIYVELRQEQAAHLDEVHKRHETELKLKESDMKRCEVRKCLEREPQTGY